MLPRPLILQVAHPVEVSHVMKDEFSVLQADETGARVALVAPLDQMLKAQPGKPRRLDAVKWRGIATLL